MSHAAFSRRHWLAASSGLLAAAALRSPNACAQVVAGPAEPAAEPDGGDSSAPTYGEAKSFDWQFGMKLSTPVTFTAGLGTFPIPMDWPEQTVTLASRDVSGPVTQLQTRDLQGGARQAVVGIARMTAHQSLDVLLNVRIDKRNIIAPTQTDSLVIPKRVPREMRAYLGNSPMIDATHGKIRLLSRELAAEAVDDTSAWQTVRRIYDRVREQVTYTEGPIRNASDALQDGKGDCEDMTSLFVALCRNANIPARMVWIPGHCYPEFYLEEQAGGEASGHWYPCQAAGTEQFGEMQEDRPILQKGDRFKIPEQRQIVRYVSEYFRCDRSGQASPSVKFVSEMQHSD
ncbi:transglutaminase-like domain-containing protein [Allorhodopirellula heiligendammensis]|uniref:Transglutaminase-like superfamily protein n=1 Tax=Allorhodopirellula heiligendammensis TaxID=2714739 RepID=A0A5C6C490_9BACT|nr:transglutaminase-like domain-containing protein [Allorhodopirellula heiligendammensis]TWU18336.1 Transglutaminase-like superfamily protein [Allorhodopirellula heiligendammensis]